MMYTTLTFERAEVVDDAIVFHFRLKNDDSHARILGYQFELWQTADTGGNRERRIGELRLDAQATIGDSQSRLKTSLKPDQETPLRLIWAASSDDLQKIEDHRAGMSPVFRIRPLLLVDAVWPNDGPRDKWRTEFGWDGPNCGNGWPMFVPIPDHEWIRLLDRLNFKHHTLDRLKWPAMPPAFRRSEDHLADAWKKHRTGDVEGTLSSCYKAFECLGFNLYGEEDMNRKKVMELLMAEEPPEKRDTVLRLMKQMQDFFHLARHESAGPVKLGYLDAQLAVVCATAMMSYLAPMYLPNPTGQP